MYHVYKVNLNKVYMHVYMYSFFRSVYRLVFTLCVLSVKQTALIHQEIICKNMKSSPLSSFWFQGI